MEPFQSYRRRSVRNRNVKYQKDSILGIGMSHIASEAVYKHADGPDSGNNYQHKSVSLFNHQNAVLHCQHPGYCHRRPRGP
jgi:hypothetical protein